MAVTVRQESEYLEATNRIIVWLSIGGETEADKHDLTLSLTYDEVVALRKALDNGVIAALCSRNGVKYLGNGIGVFVPGAAPEGK